MGAQWMIPVFPAAAATFLIIWTFFTQQRWLPTVAAVAALLVVGIVLTAFAQV